MTTEDAFLSKTARTIKEVLTSTCAREAPHVQISVRDTAGHVEVRLSAGQASKVLEVSPRLVDALTPGCMDHVWEAIEQMPSGLQTVREP